MPETTDQWVHFRPRQNKRKRAELVCVICHSKKIKCDLQSRSHAGSPKCTNCELADHDCHVRPSNRGKQKHVTFINNNNEDSSLSNKNVPLASEPRGQSADSQSLPAAASYSLETASTIADIPHARQDEATFLEVQYPAFEHSHETLPPPLQTVDADTSPKEGLGHSHTQTGDVDTGFLQIYGPENRRTAEQQELAAILEPNLNHAKPFHDELLPIFTETYFEYCYVWCPVLDRDTLDQELVSSPLLANAVALAASHIRPPLTPYEGPATYYNRAKAIFYFDEEADSLTALKALTLFYWWAPRPPSTAHRHSSWWWTSTTIRIAQQMNVHREPAEGNPLRARLNLSLRRRIWWTAFARERLTALCQSKPCIIDPDDCSITEVQASDFPEDYRSQRQGKIFLYWTRLCAIIGRVAKHQSRVNDCLEPAAATHLVQELASWAQSLPPELQLSIKTPRAVSFDRDIYQLHLPYLTTIIVLHLRKSTQQLPQAFPPAILAASCIARIMRDILSRGDTRWLMAISCWYIGTAYIALLQASNIEHFAAEAHEGLDILERMARQLETMWGSAGVIRQGFERLKRTCSPQSTESALHPFPAASLTTYQGLDPNLGRSFSQRAIDLDGDFDWTSLFPFASPETNRIAQLLLGDQRDTNLQTPADSPLREAWWNQYQDLVQPVLNTDKFDVFDMMGAF